MKFRVIAKSDQFSKRIKSKLIKGLNLEYNNENPDYVFAVGGDGTFLKACHMYPNAILFGIHTGHLGFYSNFSINDLDALINAVNENNFSVSTLPIIKCRVDSLNKTEYFGLNEVTVMSTHRTLIFDIYIDNIFFEEFRGTGLCISTPYGSTAYNRSLGGAIVDHSIPSLQITEIAGIESNQFRSIGSPLILGEKHKIKLVTKSLYKNIYVNSDNLSEEHSLLKEIEFKLDVNGVKVASLNDTIFIERIKKSFLRRQR